MGRGVNYFGELGARGGGLNIFEGSWAGEVTLAELCRKNYKTDVYLIYTALGELCTNLGWLHFTSRCDVFYILSSIFQSSQFVIKCCQQCGSIFIR